MLWGEKNVTGRWVHFPLADACDTDVLLQVLDQSAQVLHLKITCPDLSRSRKGDGHMTPSGGGKDMTGGSVKLLLCDGRL